MNGPIVKALFRDAYAQVVDNLVFRLLVVMLIVFVLPTFLVQLTPDGLRVMFAFQYRWDELFGAREIFSAAGEADDLHITIIEWIQRGVADHLAGKVGVLLCVTATAFFVPRMLEKGAADTLFSKPVSRMALLLSRYAAGLIFVAALSVGLIGGMHLGFSLVSGHSMEGFLWSIPMLVYLFAIMHAFSMMMGVLTRSSVAAILLTVVFFFVNWGVHGSWEAKQIVTDADFFDELREEAEIDVEDVHPFVRLLGRALDATHYALPKTRDARRVVGLMRARVDRRSDELHDAESKLTVEAAPAGFEREPRSSLGRDGVLWIAPEPEGGETHITLKRKNPGEFENRETELEALEAQLEGRPGISALSNPRAALAGRSGHGLIWHESRGAANRLREHWFFASGVWLFELDVDADAGLGDTAEFRALLDRFIAGMRFEDDLAQFGSQSPWETYTERFGWRAPWPYNAWISIGTTLLFAILTLLAGWWRLSRIDF